MICSICSLLMILAFILVLMKDIKIDSGWISAIATVASFSLLWTIWKDKKKWDIPARIERAIENLCKALDCEIFNC